MKNKFIAIRVITWGVVIPTLIFANIKTTIIVLIIIFIIRHYLKNKMKNDVLKNKKAFLDELTKYDDITIAPHEKDISNKLYEMLSVVNEQQEAYDLGEELFYKGINQIGLEAFKNAMWRLDDIKTANEYFNNPGYINVCTEKFSNDIRNKIVKDEFKNITQNKIDNYYLDWVIKFKDEVQSINSFFS